MIHNEHKLALMRGMAKSQEQFKFWSTQPVLRLGQFLLAVGPWDFWRGRRGLTDMTWLD